MQAHQQVARPAELVLTLTAPTGAVNAGTSPMRQALSSPRLSLFQSFFKTASDEATLGAFLWHEAVRASLLPLLGLVELVLRNSIHTALSQLVDRVPSTPWYDASHPRAIPLAGAARRSADDLLRKTDDDGRRIVQSPDDFVANATFGFWIEVMRQLEKGRRYRLAQTMFPGYAALKQPTDWRTSVPWDALVHRLRQHKIFRDWVAHFRPLWKWKYLDGVTGRLLTPVSPGAAMMSLRQEMSRMVTTLHEMNPSFTALWSGTFSHRHFFQLTTTKALFHFQRQACGREPLSETRDPRFAVATDLWTTPALDRVSAFLKWPA